MSNPPQTLGEALRALTRLEEQIERLRKENARLREENARLRKRLEESQRANKRQAAPFSKGAPKGEPKRPGRKPGDAYGAQARRTVPTEIDEVYHVPPPCSCPCGGTVFVTGEVESQYQTEIPPQRPIHREFRLEQGRCSSCGRCVQGRHPLQTSDAIGAAASQLGPEAQALIAVLNKEMGLSYGKIKRLFQALFGIVLSRGGAARILARVAVRCEPNYQAIQVVVQQSREVTPDETGWRIGGRLAWLWAFATPVVTLYVIAASRGFDVAVAVLGIDFAGRLIHDGWAVYDRFEAADHQQCLAHIDRRCAGLLETATSAAARFPAALREVIGDALDLRDRRDRGEVSKHGVAIARGRLESRLEELLLAPYRDPANRRLADHVYEHRDQLFTFLDEPGIPATNWRGEQAIRPAVVNRKVWGGNRTETGARTQAVLMSVLRTCAQLGRDALEHIRAVVCTPRGQAPPALITPEIAGFT
jgi:transposase